MASKFKIMFCSFIFFTSLLFFQNVSASESIFNSISTTTPETGSTKFFSITFYATSTNLSSVSWYQTTNNNYTCPMKVLVKSHNNSRRKTAEYGTYQVYPESSFASSSQFLYFENFNRASGAGWKKVTFYNPVQLIPNNWYTVFLMFSASASSDCLNYPAREGATSSISFLGYDNGNSNSDGFTYYTNKSLAFRFYSESTFMPNYYLLPFSEQTTNSNIESTTIIYLSSGSSMSTTTEQAIQGSAYMLIGIFTFVLAFLIFLLWKK